MIYLNLLSHLSSISARFVPKAKPTGTEKPLESLVNGCRAAHITACSTSEKPKPEVPETSRYIHQYKHPIFQGKIGVQSGKKCIYIYIYFKGTWTLDIWST